ncbi:immunity 22 family protein [Bacillus sp. FJAT-27251]|uniref:immunity 22 family protein n=1 Tax=Bacillus sp. FJAT-27251 TaxID=1684142 RepID=UPI0006A7884B|nr:immunity 22 family protein [Bacillus sp. FJAT-27251]
MEREGYVSLWVGEFDSREKLDDYLEIKFTEDGDALLSSFEKAFSIEYYDIDFREAVLFKQPPAAFQEILKGFSYDEIIFPRFAGQYAKGLPHSYNAVVLLYNFEYDGGSAPAKGGANQLGYIGAVFYR